MSVGIFLLIRSSATSGASAASGSLGEMRLWMFDIGQGDALFLEAPDGTQLLMDGGRDSKVLAKLGAVMKPWDRTIDYVVSSHLDADHIGGLPSVLERYEVKDIWGNGETQRDTKIAKRFNLAVGEEGAVVRSVRAGEKYDVGGVTVDVLSPDAMPDTPDDTSANNHSVVLKLTYGDTTILLTGDIEKEVEEAIAPSMGDIDILKAGHHGSSSSNSQYFLDTITPEIALISAGADNSYGHPHVVVLHRFADRNIEVFRTDQQGDILVKSTGGEPTVSAERLPY